MQCLAQDLTNCLKPLVTLLSMMARHPWARGSSVDSTEAKTAVDGVEAEVGVGAMVVDLEAGGTIMTSSQRGVDLRSQVR